MTEQSDSMDTHSSNDDIMLSDNTPSDQSERITTGVAEAALQDGEKGSNSTNSSTLNLFYLKTLTVNM